MLHSSGSMQHDITIGCKADINKNIRGAPIEVTHAQQYAARCHTLQVKKLLEEWVVKSRRSRHRNRSPPLALLQGMPFVPSHQPALLMPLLRGGNAVIPMQKKPQPLSSLVVSTLRRRMFPSSWRKSWRHWKTRITSQMANWSSHDGGSTGDSRGARRQHCRYVINSIVCTMHTAHTGQVVTRELAALYSIIFKLQTRPHS